jgi:hypothetical protein
LWIDVRRLEVQHGGLRGRAEGLRAQLTRVDLLVRFEEHLVKLTHGGAGHAEDEGHELASVLRIMRAGASLVPSRGLRERFSSTNASTMSLQDE